MRLRDLREGDLEQVRAIYDAAVRGSAATFDLEPPGPEKWAEILAGLDPGAGRLAVVAVEGGDRVLGYARTGPFRERRAYDSTVETSVYVAEDARGRGVGHALYGELLARLDRCGARLAVAGVTDPNPASRALHLAHGFTVVGTFAAVGVKFGRTWDVTWYQRPLAGAPALPQGS
jgi:phosphinothricin acetyltransferase